MHITPRDSGAPRRRGGRPQWAGDSQLQGDTKSDEDKNIY